MKSNTFTILYQILKVKKNNQGKCPIRCRITYKNQRKEFSTGLIIKPEHWCSESQNAKFFSESSFINDNLLLIKQNLQDAYLKLKLVGVPFTVTDILSKYKGESTSEELGVLAAFNLHNEHIKKLVGKDIQLVTYSKYLETYTHIESFIKWKFKNSDVILKQLKGSFLDDLQYYLVTEKSFQQSTINKVIQRFRKVIKYAIVSEYLAKDPFIAFKNKPVKKQIIFLTKEELKKLENHKFDNARLEKIKDMFVFCCYTGLGFKEMAKLKWTDIHKGFDNELWLEVKRQKTGKSYKVPLFDVVKVIIYKYKPKVDEFVLPSISNSNFNAFEGNSCHCRY